jgi:hypothetical protein
MRRVRYQSLIIGYAAFSLVAVYAGAFPSSFFLPIEDTAHDIQLPYSRGSVHIGCAPLAPALGIQPFCRFGNNFIQLVFCLVHAHMAKVKQVIVPYDFLGITDSFMTTDGYRVFPENQCYPNGTFTKKWWNTPRHYPVSADFVVNSFRGALLRFFPQSDLPPDALVLHIRSDDNFKVGDHATFWQPSCSFFLNVMDRYPANPKIVLTTDDGNPCVGIVLKRNATWVKGTLKTDFARMIYARHFVLSRSTLSSAAATLSPLRQQLYLHGDFLIVNWKRFSRRVVHRCRPSRKYLRLMKERFQAIPRHLEAILYENCTWVS